MGRVEKILFAWLVAMLVGVTATGAYVVVEHATRCSRFTFSAADWRAPHADRGKIAHRLVECHRLDGLSGDEVLARLGKPQDRSRFKRRLTLGYNAGSYEGFIFGGTEMLEVELSARHLVRRVWIDQIND